MTYVLTLSLKIVAKNIMDFGHHALNVAMNDLCHA